MTTTHFSGSKIKLQQSNQNQQSAISNEFNQHSALSIQHFEGRPDDTTARAAPARGSRLHRGVSLEQTRDQQFGGC
jgi:hypothetical protein